MPINNASRYFSFLARHFPVMCASDEFYFMPRAEEAAKHYGRLENFDRDSFSEDLQQIHGFRDIFEKISVPAGDQESSIDKSLLLSNIDGILIELEEKNVLRYNPLIYLKVAFIGLNHAVSRPAESAETIRDRTMERLGRIPGLLKQAENNLEHVPVSFFVPAQNMIEDCIEYIDEVKRYLSRNAGPAYIKTLDTLCKKTISSLSGFKQFLKLASSEAAETMTDLRMIGSRKTSDTIEATLHRHFLNMRSLEDVYRIGKEERMYCLAELNRLRTAIDPEKTWQELYDEYIPTKGDIFSLYRSEHSRLCEFFSSRGFDVPVQPHIVHTPRYLQSVRGPASFSASLPTDGPGSDFFYITTETDFPYMDMPGSEKGNTEIGRLQKKENLLRHEEKPPSIRQRTNRRLHREYKFLTAHETIPGHHLLDSRRRMLANPIRRQIESPLFYEGWSCYAESLLIEYGYIDSKIELLVNQKRELWRAARCQIDAGLAAGLLDMNGCIDLLLEAGFEEDEARSQIDRFLLNPGYQLCYTLGRWEILRLKNQYSPPIGLENFHRTLLCAGELPFTLLEKLLAGHRERRNIK